MGKKVDNMVGRKFGRWQVLEESKNRKLDGTIMYLCECECGTRKNVSGTNLRNGTSLSCGCYNNDVIRKFGDSVYKEKLYSVWSSMRVRCNTKTDKAYHNYGGRGIKVCDEWNNYRNFKDWAYRNGYKEGLWIDRINNDGNYEPSNCRWNTPKEQQRNKRTNRIIKIGNETKTIKEWSEISGIKWSTIERRIELGWETKDLLNPIEMKYSHSEEIRKALGEQCNENF